MLPALPRILYFEYKIAGCKSSLVLTKAGPRPQANHMSPRKKRRSRHVKMCSQIKQVMRNDNECIAHYFRVCRCNHDTDPAVQLLDRTASFDGGRVLVDLGARSRPRLTFVACSRGSPCQAVSQVDPALRPMTLSETECFAVFAIIPDRRQHHGAPGAVQPGEGAGRPAAPEPAAFEALAGGGDCSGGE